jgi:hypothetical protein
MPHASVAMDEWNLLSKGEEMQLSIGSRENEEDARWEQMRLLLHLT